MHDENGENYVKVKNTHFHNVMDTYIVHTRVHGNYRRPFKMISSSFGAKRTKQKQSNKMTQLISCASFFVPFGQYFVVPISDVGFSIATIKNISRADTAIRETVTKAPNTPHTRHILLCIVDQTWILGVKNIWVARTKYLNFFVEDSRIVSPGFANNIGKNTPDLYGLTTWMKVKHGLGRFENLEY